MSNRNFDHRVIIQRLQQQNYARNLYLYNTNGIGLIQNPQTSDGTSSQFHSFVPGSQTEYFQGLLGSNVTSSIGGIVNLPPYPVEEVIPSSIPVPPVTTGGSMVFDSGFGASGSHVSYPNDTSLRIGTQPFTIEWFQYWIGGSPFPRVFSIGKYPSANIAVSYEGDFIFWINGSPLFLGSGDPPQNVWTHIAIVGDGSFLTFYIDGIEVPGVSVGYNFSNSTTALMIGNETNPSSDANFNGQITNFRWVVGTTVYTSNFTPPTTPLTNISGTQLLLLASTESTVVTDSSSAGRTATNTGVTYSTTTPF